MPDLDNSLIDAELTRSPFNLWDKVLYVGLEWIVLNPKIGVEDKIETVLIGRGEYFRDKLIVPVNLLSFPKTEDLC